MFRNGPPATIGSLLPEPWVDSSKTCICTHRRAWY
jgi:hypothetical protein